MANYFKGVVKLTESQYNQMLTDGYVTVGDTTIEFDANTLYVTDYMDNEFVLPTNIVTTDENQTIIALKDFTGGLTKNGFDVATLNDIPPVIDTLEPDKTQVNVSTSSLSVNQGMILDEKIKNMMNALNGQNSSFTFETLEDLLTAFGKSDLLGEEAADSYLVNTNKITYNGEEKTLHNGDVFWIIDSSVADYWYSSDNKTIYKLETQKVDLAEYAKLSDLSNLATNSSLADYAKKTDLSDYATNASLAAYAKLTDLTNYAKTSDLTAYAKTSEVSDKYLSKEDFANWADNAKPADNVVITDENSTQTIKGLKTFEKTVEAGTAALSSKSGFTNIRKAANDSNNIHQLELFVENNGDVMLTHKNRSVSTTEVDAYVKMNASDLKFKNSLGEFNVLTANGGVVSGKLSIQNTNPHIEFSQTDVSKISYIQMYEGKLGIGPGWENSLKIDENGRIQFKGYFYDGDTLTSGNYMSLADIVTTGSTQEITGQKSFKKDVISFKSTTSSGYATAPSLISCVYTNQTNSYKTRGIGLRATNSNYGSVYIERYHNNEGQTSLYSDSYIRMTGEDLYFAKDPDDRAGPNTTFYPKEYSIANASHFRTIWKMTSAEDFYQKSVNITLSENIANFGAIDVYFYHISGSVIKCQRFAIHDGYLSGIQISDFYCAYNNIPTYYYRTLSFSSVTYGTWSAVTARRPDGTDVSSSAGLSSMVPVRIVGIDKKIYNVWED